VFGWISPADRAVAGHNEPATFQIEGAHWVVDLNRRYDAMPESRRFWVFPAVLVIAGAVNMLLTIGNGFPFGLLFLLALLALVAIRAPYAAGWFKPAATLGTGTEPVAPYPTEVGHTQIPAIASDPTPSEVPSPAPAEMPDGQHAANDPPRETE